MPIPRSRVVPVDKTVRVKLRKDDKVQRADGSLLRNLKAASFSDSGARVLLDSQVASSSSTLDFVTGLDGTYKRYTVELVNVIPGTDNVNLQMQVSTDGGATWQTGATAYAWSTGGYDSAGNLRTSNSTGDSSIGLNDLTSGVRPTTTAGNALSAVIELSDPADTTLKASFRYHTIYLDGSSRVVGLRGAGAYKTAGAINGLRFKFSSGNIASGTINLYGIP